MVADMLTSQNDITLLEVKAEEVSGDHFPDRRDISTGAGRRCVLDSLLHCYRSVAAGGRDRLHGSEGGGGYRAGNCVYI